MGWPAMAKLHGSPFQNSSFQSVHDFVDALRVHMLVCGQCCIQVFPPALQEVYSNDPAPKEGDGPTIRQRDGLGKPARSSAQSRAIATADSHSKPVLATSHPIGDKKKKKHLNQGDHIKPLPGCIIWRSSARLTYLVSCWGEQEILACA
jgi:hypothetical protein